MTVLLKIGSLTVGIFLNDTQTSAKSVSKIMALVRLWKKLLCKMAIVSVFWCEQSAACPIEAIQFTCPSMPSCVPIAAKPNTASPIKAASRT